MIEKAKLENKKMDWSEAFKFMCEKAKNKVKREDWGNGKYFYILDGHLYRCEGKKTKNKAGEIIDECNISTLNNAELFAKNYVVCT